MMLCILKNCQKGLFRFASYFSDLTDLILFVYFFNLNKSNIVLNVINYLIDYRNEIIPVQKKFQYLNKKSQ